jgi:pimeloyl-ACP methyl ester carboxylesterase
MGALWVLPLLEKLVAIQFHFHGAGRSRLEVKLMALQAKQHGMLLISLDRPGYSLSQPKPGTYLLDWPADVVNVADQLGIDKYAVDGVSAGGPYALACAYQIPSRLTACAMISSFPPGELMLQVGPPWMRLT